MRFHPTQNLDVLGHICLGLCPVVGTVTIPSYFDDCRFDTFVSKGLTVTSLIHIIDTPMFPVPSFRPSMRSKRTWLSFLEQQPKRIYLVAKGGTGIPAAKVHRLRWLRQFKGPFLCHRW